MEILSGASQFTTSAACSATANAIITYSLMAACVIVFLLILYVISFARVVVKNRNEVMASQAQALKNQTEMLELQRQSAERLARIVELLERDRTE